MRVTTDCQFLLSSSDDYDLFVAVEVGGASVLTCESIYQICQQLIMEVNLTTEECLEGHVEDPSNSTESVSSAEGKCMCSLYMCVSGCLMCTSCNHK